MRARELLIQVEAELRAAESARTAGNEGRARVCARRAAGLAAGAYLTGRGQPARGASAYDRLRRLESAAGLAEDLRRAAARLTARVDAHHRLPHEQDPLEDARLLIAGLLDSDGAGGKG